MTTSSVLYWINWVVNASFIIDIAFNFLLPYREHIRKGGALVKAHSRIARHYLRGWFLIDIVSVRRDTHAGRVVLHARARACVCVCVCAPCARVLRARVCAPCARVLRARVCVHSTLASLDTRMRSAITHPPMPIYSHPIPS